MTVLTYGRNNSSTIKVRRPAVLCTRTARMRSKRFACTLLQPLIVSILVSITTGELEYYQDIVAESPADIALKQLARYLEAQPQKQYALYHNRLQPHLTSRTQKEHLLELEREKERKILEDLTEKSNNLYVLQKQRMNQLSYEQQAQEKLMEEYNGRKARAPPYFDKILRPLSEHFENNPIYKQPLFNDRLKSQDDAYDTPEKQGEDEDDEELEEEEQVEHGMKEVPFLDYRTKQINPLVERENQKNIALAKTTEPNPEFTFRFDEPKVHEEQPFAVRVDDPRYYEDGFSTAIKEKLHPYDITERIPVTSAEDSSNNKEKPPRISHDIENGRLRIFEDEDVILPELHRRAEHDPMVSPVDHKDTSDIYFIAIVAGCSAAAMFALMLISLTWCRLQRGAKAAADIEYPAYGITGPNKDTSPSGDQRLAQSAQMYHFQHQKQQIIAMESRTAAARDPGSVSEAESDEENEEGDYTVYECPGLAPTGEMEVKNPLFHDDPTPATPAQSKQEGDHI